ncbi:TCR/Tet family MFS transporter [Pelomonas cellulosilytica]|uniref:TCR/Tet family MFS transporter n=1 Tax=Pelomonas cellulosilytica TaxID=2906762 RepID=A0ABS8XRJ7_9BURK|nr:TCR/Tet family MFS transporter [Pelomonas sp. P8]MCE4553527.1 TCR/Tet family MFS transporter [Pelomonas sp. P8]
MSANSPRAPAMGFIMAAVLIDMISIGLMVPVLPHIVGTFTSGNDEQTSAFLMVTLAFGVANFIGSPVLGALSDRFGRRPVLLIGFAGLALSFFVTAMATALWMLVVVRLFSGAMQANVAIANAYVADITAPEDRARRFGQLGAMFGIGFILGPVIGGWLGHYDVHWPFFAAGSMAVLNWCYGFFVLPESLPKDRRSPFDWKKANPVTALRGLTALKGVGPLVSVIALSSLAQFTLHNTWVLYTKFRFGWGPLAVSWSLFVVGLASVLSQGVLLRPLLKRFTPQRLALISMASGTLAYAGYGLATQGWMMYVVIGLNLLGGVGAAALQSFISNAAGPAHQGRAMGAVSSLNSLMAVIAPALGLSLLAQVSHRPPGDLLMGLPFFASAALQAVALLITLRFFRSQPAPQPA